MENLTDDDLEKHLSDGSDNEANNDSKMKQSNNEIDNDESNE